MWRSDEGVAPYSCSCQSKHPDKPKFETQTHKKQETIHPDSLPFLFG